MRERCGDLPQAECEARVEEAKQLALDAGVSAHLLFPDATPEEWLDCGQCRDCFKPTLRAAAARVRAVLAGALELRRARAGWLAAALPLRLHRLERQPQGAARHRLQAVRAAPDDGGHRPALRVLRRCVPARPAPRSCPRIAIRAAPGSRPQDLQGLLALDTERVASFLYPGGLVAVHSEGRTREQIWDALERREVYGTSGPRLLLWFDLLNGPDGPLPMGGATSLAQAPRFEVRAVGAFVQKPGCPDCGARQALGAERLEYLCRGECYNPSDERIPIAAIEVVRIRPQMRAGEPVDPLIEDPWRRFECPPDPNGCVVHFEDPEFVAGGRDALYYVRALQEATPAVNGANLRTAFDADGKAVKTSPCFGDYRTPFDDDCLAPVQERAWSSPIFVDQPRGAVSASR